MRKLSKLIILSLSLVMVFLIFHVTTYAWWSTGPTYHIEISYVYEDGTTAFDTISGNLVEGGRYEVHSKEIEGYSPDQDVVSGYLYSDTYIVVTYYKLINEYTLTINYLYNGEAISEQYINTFKENDEYYIESPIITGYTPDKDVITGIISEDTSIDVNYDINQYTLTINYLDEDNNLLDTINYSYDYNENYHIIAKDIEGYTPVISEYDGIILDDTSIDIYYNKNIYTITIHFLDTNNNKLMDDYKLEYKYNDEYKIEIPDIKNYIKSDDILTGTIKEDLEFNIVYKQEKYRLTIHFVDMYYNRLYKDIIIYERPNTLLLITVPVIAHYSYHTYSFLYVTNAYDTDLYIIYKPVLLMKTKIVNKKISYLDSSSFVFLYN